MLNEKENDLQFAIKQYNPYSSLLCDDGLFLAHNADVITHDDVLIVAPMYNSVGKKDATGAFHVGVKQFSAFHGLDADKVTYYFDNSQHRKVVITDVLMEIECRRPKVFVAFCHGHAHGIQFGLRSPSHPTYSQSVCDSSWDDFVCGLSSYVKNGFTAPVVALYACSTGSDYSDYSCKAPGSGDGSFADALRDNLCMRGASYCSVFAHTTVGHSWYNPNIKRFDGHGSLLGATGAMMLAMPGTDAYRQAVKLLRSTDFAWRIPFMPISVIHKALM